MDDFTELRPGLSDPPPPYNMQPDYSVVNAYPVAITTRQIDESMIGLDPAEGVPSELLDSLLQHLQRVSDEPERDGESAVSSSMRSRDSPDWPRANIVMHVVGSRGDVQPFIALGKELVESCGHRVRLATHPIFKQLVETNGLEFFPIGGDPKLLMNYMVQNPSLIPRLVDVRNGELARRRNDVAECLEGCWRSCFESTASHLPGTRHFSDPGFDGYALHDAEDASRPSFVADCIIANPPSFAHVHCAEKLGIPLQIVFTMPYSPTGAFAHPMTKASSTRRDHRAVNYISYHMVDMMMWHGLGDIINTFRTESLGLQAVSVTWASGMLDRLKIPHMYCWSQSLLPKPPDWGSHISIPGYFHLRSQSSFVPPASLVKFLDAGAPPVYIGFGSVVLPNAAETMRTILEAIHLTGERAVISKGWAGYIQPARVLNNVFLVDDVPHEWLFEQVSCVVHHGGAGTTAAGLAAGRTTGIVPFFGDQHLWGEMVHRAGVGPEPTPIKQLTVAKLADMISYCLRPDIVSNAQQMAYSLGAENGVETAARVFHEQVCIDALRCSVAPGRVAAWNIRETMTPLSAVAASVLTSSNLLSFDKLEISRPREYNTEQGPWDPLSGSVASILKSMTEIVAGAANTPRDAIRLVRKGLDKAHGNLTKSKGSSARSPGRGDAQKLVLASEHPDAWHRAPGPSRDPVSSIGSALSETPADFCSQPSHCIHSMHDTTEGTFVKDTNLDRPLESGKGLTRVVRATLKSPVDFTMALSQGFHSIPLLYGDRTVRTPGRVNGVRSGLKVAAQEFGFGIYDGITGLVTQPMNGAATGRTLGFVKGFGVGVCGALIKPCAAFFALPGYTMDGVHKSLRRLTARETGEGLTQRRMEQGRIEEALISSSERDEIIRKWTTLCQELERRKGGKAGCDGREELLQGLLEEHRDHGVYSESILPTSSLPSSANNRVANWTEANFVN